MHFQHLYIPHNAQCVNQLTNPCRRRVTGATYSAKLIVRVTAPNTYSGRHKRCPLPLFLFCRSLRLSILSLYRPPVISFPFSFILLPHPSKVRPDGMGSWRPARPMRGGGLQPSSTRDRRALCATAACSLAELLDGALELASTFSFFSTFYLLNFFH